MASRLVVRNPATHMVLGEKPLFSTICKGSRRYSLLTIAAEIGQLIESCCTSACPVGTTIMSNQSLAHNQARMEALC